MNVYKTTRSTIVTADSRIDKRSRELSLDSWVFWVIGAVIVNVASMLFLPILATLALMVCELLMGLERQRQGIRGAQRRRGDKPPTLGPSDRTRGQHDRHSASGAEDLHGR